MGVFNLYIWKIKYIPPFFIKVILDWFDDYVSYLYEVSVFLVTKEDWSLKLSPGEGKGYLLQYSGLENSVDCIVHGVAKSQTRLSDLHFHFLSLLLNYLIH